MRPIPIIVALAISMLPGCTAARLRQRTVNQASTLPELQYQQVLNNLALFATNPAALPWHVNLREGTTQVTDSLSGGAALDTGPPVTWFPQLLGSRTAVAQWGMSPVIEPVELRLLRIAYRRAHGSPEMPSAEFLDELAHELKDQLPLNPDLRSESELFYEYQSRKANDLAQLEARVVTTNDESPCIPAGSDRSPLARNVCRQVDVLQRDLARIRPGWFGVGRWRDVPRDACYVGRSGDTYAWVCPAGREALTDFTLTAMKFSTLVKETQTLINPGSVKFSPGDRGGG
jgi:hypothetical protein